MGNRYHQIAGSNPACAQRELQGVGAVRNTDCVRDADLSSKLLFESFDFIAEDIRATFQNPGKRAIYLLFVNKIIGSRATLGNDEHTCPQSLKIFIEMPAIEVSPR